MLIFRGEALSHTFPLVGSLQYWEGIFYDPCHVFFRRFFLRGADFICEVSITRESGGYHSNHELHLPKSHMSKESQPFKDVSSIKTC